MLKCILAHVTTVDTIANIYILLWLTMSASEDLFPPHKRLLKYQEVHQAKDIENLVDWWWCVLCQQQIMSQSLGNCKGG